MQKFLRTTSVLVLVALPTTNSFAQTSSSSLPELFACRLIEDNLERVKCYDRITDELQVADKKGEIVTITKKQVEEMERESFGFNLPSIPKLSSLFGKTKLEDGNNGDKPKKSSKKNPVQNLIVPIRSTKVFNRNKTRFYLENGQVWEQTGGRSLRIRLRDDRKTFAHINKGTLSGYRLRVDGKGVMITVRRTK